MEVAIFKNDEEASRAAAHLIARLVRARPAKTVLGLATGDTPLRTYAELARLHAAGRLSFASVQAFNLDEYVGVATTDARSYGAYMRENFFSRTDIRPSNCHIPNGLAVDTRAECASYEAKIRAAGGIDLQLLGLGKDGHIGFNEPSSSLASRTRLKTLTSETREANAKHFGSSVAVPRHVLTMGLATIMEARHCVLLAFGAAKADAVAKMVEGPLTASLPASLLQMHEKCTVILDEAAAARLERRSYYLEVFSGKPDWQRWDLPLD
jgi:glucosamine-6-phosphate deaminase